MKRHVCRKCFEPRTSHCDEYIDLVLPDGCICDAEYWVRHRNQICNDYNAPSGDCQVCEHPERCHVERDRVL